MKTRKRQAGVTLVELLVVMVIMGVISGTLIFTWFALTDSYSFTTDSSNAQDFARDAVARMGRELRDAEPKGADLPLISADNDEIVFTTTFNEAGNENRTVEPVWTRYYYAYDASRGVGQLHRQRGSVDRIIVDNLLNPTYVDADGKTRADIFRYDYIASDSTYVTNAPVPDPEMLGTISMIRIHLIVDVNPGKAPKGMDVSTTIHLRNQSGF